MPISLLNFIQLIYPLNPPNLNCMQGWRSLVKRARLKLNPFSFQKEKGFTQKENLFGPKENFWNGKSNRGAISGDLGLRGFCPFSFLLFALRAKDRKRLSPLYGRKKSRKVREKKETYTCARAPKNPPPCIFLLSRCIP